LRQALRAAHKPCEIVVYSNAQHGFNADYRSSYQKEAATDGGIGFSRGSKRTV